MSRVARLGLARHWLAQQNNVRSLGQAGGGEEALHHVLVHGRGGAENARADVGDVGPARRGPGWCRLRRRCRAARGRRRSSRRLRVGCRGLREVGPGACVAEGPWRAASGAGVESGAARRSAGRPAGWWRTQGRPHLWRCSRAGAKRGIAGRAARSALRASRASGPACRWRWGRPSYFLRSMALRMEDAESSETSCSRSDRQRECRCGVFSSWGG